MNVFLENINHFFLAWLCHASRKRMFLQSEQKYDWRSYIYISLLQNECNLFGFQQQRSRGYFPKWNLKPPSPVHKRQNESPEEATCLQNSLKAMQGWMDFLHQWKDRWHQDSSSRLQQSGGGREPSEIRVEPRSAGSHALPSPPSRDQQPEMPRKVVPAGSWASKARDTLDSVKALYWVSRGPHPSAAPFCGPEQAKVRCQLL